MIMSWSSFFRVYVRHVCAQPSVSLKKFESSDVSNPCSTTHIVSDKQHSLDMVKTARELAMELSDDDDSFRIKACIIEDGTFDAESVAEVLMDLWMTIKESGPPPSVEANMRLLLRVLEERSELRAAVIAELANEPYRGVIPGATAAARAIKELLESQG